MQFVDDGECGDECDRLRWRRQHFAQKEILKKCRLRTLSAEVELAVDLYFIRRKTEYYRQTFYVRTCREQGLHASHGSTKLVTTGAENLF